MSARAPQSVQLVEGARPGTVRRTLRPALRRTDVERGLLPLPAGAVTWRTSAGYAICGTADTMGVMNAKPEPQHDETVAPASSGRPSISPASASLMTPEQKQRAIDQMLDQRRSVYDALGQ